MRSFGKWGGLTVICDSGAPFHMPSSSTGMMEQSRVECLHADGERCDIPDRELW